MRTKSLQEPTGVSEGHEWLSPDGHQPKWHRVFQDGKWIATVYEDPNFPQKEEEEVEYDPKKVMQQKFEEEEDLDESDDTEEEEQSTEETKGEQRNETAVSDRDGKQEPDAGAKQPADGKQGKGRQGKRRK